MNFNFGLFLSSYPLPQMILALAFMSVTHIPINPSSNIAFLHHTGLQVRPLQFTNPSNHLPKPFDSTLLPKKLILYLNGVKLII